MKKNTCLLLVLLVPFFGLTQGVKANLFDKFLKKQRVEMEPVVISGLSGNNRLSLAFSAVASTLYLNLSGAGWGASTVDKDNELVLLLANDSALHLKATSLQSFEPGLMQNVYRHQYYLTFHDLDLLSRIDLVGLRKYSFDAYSDLSLTKENYAGIKKMSELFLQELKKAKIDDAVKQIDIREIRNYIGDSVAFCSKVFRTRYFQGSEGGPTLLDVQADFADPFVNVVILEKDRSTFSNAPEKIFLNKDVCISGVVRLRNNLPYLEIRRKDQIRLTSPVSFSEINLFAGDSVTVSGKVFAVRSAANEKTPAMLLSMGAPFPDQPLTVVLESLGSHQSNAAYLNQYIRVSGKVVRTDAGLQMIVRNQEQLAVLDGETSSSFFATAQEDPEKQTAVLTAAPTGITNAEKGQLNETLAEYPGGAAAFTTYLEKNLVNPLRAKAGEQKQVIVSFEIDAQGTCRGIKIVGAPGPAFEQEIKNVLLKMPKWKPAFSKGRFVATRITQPVHFKN